MKYTQFIKIISNYQGAKIIPGLDRISAAMNELNNIQNGYKSIHIAGTKGKGSVAYMLESVLNETQIKTGLFTSPHILDFTERFRINKHQVSENKIVEIFEKYRNIIEKYKLTYFETSALLAFVYFYQENVDIAIFETGLGGRFDATNIITPAVTLITPVDIDHTDFLGSNITDIAKEKGGIIKSGVKNFLYSENEEVTKIIKNVARQMNSEFENVFDTGKTDVKKFDLNGIEFNYTGKSYYLPLIGLHQVQNASLCIKASEYLRNFGFNVLDNHIKNGLNKTILEGRTELIFKNPIFIVDCAHNFLSFKVLKETICRYLPGKRINLIFGIMKDKDYVSVLKMMKPITENLILIKLKDKRAARLDELKKYSEKLEINVLIFKESKNAVKYVLEKNNPAVAAGSFKVVESIKKILIKNPRLF